MGEVVCDQQILAIFLLFLPSEHQRQVQIIKLSHSFSAAIQCGTHFHFIYEI